MRKTGLFLAVCLAFAYGPSRHVTPRPSWVPVSASGADGTSLRWQLQIAKDEKLTFIANEEVFESLKANGKLVHLPQNRFSVIDWRLGEEWRYATPQVSDFLNDFGGEAVSATGKPLQANSAARTPNKQTDIRAVDNGTPNYNATSVAKSSHLYGSTVDIAKSDYLGEKIVWRRIKGKMHRVKVLNLVPRYTDAQLNWMRSRLLDMEQQNLIEFTEEKNQSVFHIMVRRHYGTRKLNLGVTRTLFAAALGVATIILFVAILGKKRR